MDAELYNSEALLPPGMTNIASNCYANSIIQCLLNHPTFLGLLEVVYKEHVPSSCKNCSTSGINISMNK